MVDDTGTDTPNRWGLDLEPQEEFMNDGIRFDQRTQPELLQDPSRDGEVDTNLKAMLGFLCGLVLGALIARS